MGKPVVRVGVLGAVGVWRDGDSSMLSMPATQRGLLAALALSEPSVDADRLLDLLWDDDLPASGRTWVHVAVNRLRAWIRTHVGDAVRIDRDAGGYRLAIPGGESDADRFTRLVATATATHEADERCALLTSALALWRGPVAADAPDPVRTCERAQRLNRERLAAAEQLAEAALRCTRADDALPHLGTLVEEHPFHERLHARHALLLASRGEQAAAFDLLHGLTRRLSDELGVDPGDEIREAHERLLHQSVGGRRPPQRRSYASTWRGPRCHLHRLIGRDQDKLALLGLLAGRQLVTVTGAGGCGKTTLALRVAEDMAPRFPDGVAVVALAALASAEEAVAALGAMVRINTPHGDVLSNVERLLAGRRMLLVLDNCEHLAEECAVLVRRLLGSCPDLTVLATSRQPLGVAEEAVWPLEPLAVPAAGSLPDPDTPAVALFLVRAEETLPSLALTEDEDLSHVAAICRLLDGLPLAVELAAAQLRVLDVNELHKRLRHGIGLLERASSGGDPRHRTLSAAVDWSYGLLGADECLLLRRLSGFAGGFRLADAERVCGFAPLDEAKVAPVLARLVERSLVQPQGRGEQRRFRLLQAVSVFAAERLADAGETVAVADRHLAQWLDRARGLDGLLRYRDRVAAARELEADVVNLRCALDHAYARGRVTEAAELTARLFEFWLTHRAYLREGERWLDRALACVDVAAVHEVAVLLRFHQAMLRAIRGDYLGNLALMTGITDDLARFRPREHLEARANLLTIRCSLLDPEALADAVRAVDDVRASSYPAAGTVLTATASVFTTWGRYDEAADACERYNRAPALAGRPPSPAQEAVQIEVALCRGDLARARHATHALCARLSEITNPAEQEPPRRAIALTHLAAGECEAARRFLTGATDWMRTAYPGLGARHAALWMLLAEAHRRAGDPAAGLAALVDALDASLGHSNFRHALPGVLQTALFAADLGDYEASTALAGQWDALRRPLGLPLPIGLEQAATRLGLDAEPPGQPDPAYRWTDAAFTTLIADAHAWCTKAIRGAPRGEQ
ncbi:BTAD domain-containing putative transcriptional regulator [Actinopolymorpha sp. B11F2]|uniref:ATP-binding protein n=1 Tax=Actinopolymorpha sp. B11F2 TaxID=3160862 RepID=UPI0032E3B9C7